jgi:hypothetical protein
LTCVTATNTFGDCTSTANNQAFIGVNLAKDGTTPNWATAGTATVNSHASATFTAGDYVCTDASNAAVAVDNGTTPCPNPQRQIGIVKTTNTATSHTVSLIFSSQAGASGGSGTVSNCPTAGSLGVYASTGTTIGCLGADFVFATHTLSTASTAIFDTSAQTGVASLKFPAVAGGTSLAGTATAALSSPITLVNSNSSNNNTSVGAIIGAAGSSTGGVGLLIYDVSGTGNILDVYSGGSQASGVYTPGTLEANITAAGGATFQGNGSFGGTLGVTGHVTLEGVTSTGATGTGNLVFSGTPTLVTPILGAATATSLLATGIVDGTAPITITTGTTANLGSTYKSGYTFNQEGTAGTGVTYTLPATAVGLQYCVRNSIVSGTGAADTGVLTVYPAASSYVILNGVRNTIGGGGTHGVASGGAAGDSACFVAIDATDWEVFVIRGTWTAN